MCYNTLGTIIDTVLDRIMQDVFSLRDISQIESERIASLCLLLHPLDTIFPELGNGVRSTFFFNPNCNLKCNLNTNRSGLISTLDIDCGVLRSALAKVHLFIGYPSESGFLYNWEHGKRRGR